MIVFVTGASSGFGAAITQRFAAAGYRAVAIDVRGYGDSFVPDTVEAYRMLAHVADNVAVVRGLGAASAVVVGDDVRFGWRNSGDAATLEQIGRQDGFEVEIVSTIRSDEGRRWSSTWIRQCLKDGNMRQVSRVLGRPHRLRGVVVRGLRRGRELGFPTANLEAATAGVVPPDGVYAGWLIRGCADEGDVQRLPAAISIGTNPTFDDVPQRTVEAHVLGRADLNLYGEEVGVELVERLRPMLAFDGLDALLVQMRADIEDTARILDVPVPEPIRPEDVTAQ